MLITDEGTEVVAGAVAEADRFMGGRNPRQLREANPVWRARMVEAAQIFEAAVYGDLRAQARLVESMSTSDFPYIFGDFFSRQLQASYELAPAIWPQFAARVTVPDFKPQKFLDLTGGAAFLPLVEELAPYKARGLTESQFEFSVAKRGAVLAWSWEMNINDALGAFQRAPGQLAIAARQTEDREATKMLIDSDGNGVPSWMGTPATTALSAASLQVGINAISAEVDGDGNPRVTSGLILIVPPALEMTALNIVNTTQTDDPTTGRRVVGNGLSKTPRVVVNPWLTVLNASAKDVTTWYLLPDPNGSRPAIVQAFLRGHETPDVRYQNDQGTRPGGGAVAVVEGSFERDDIRYRIRTVHGAATAYTDVAYVNEGP